MHHQYPQHLIKLIESLKKLPGVGSKSAERFAFHLLDWDAKHLHELGHLIAEIPEKLHSCHECGCLQITEHICPFCHEDREKTQSLCIIASPRDAYALEATHEFKGIYHVLGGLISPLDGRGPEKLSLRKLMERIQKLEVQDVVIAIDSTLEGDATALYLKQELSPYGLQISRLAFGIPMGSSIDYVDGGTLARAFQGRARF